MKVYMLWHYDYEQTMMCGVWSTAEGAVADFERRRKSSPQLPDSYWAEYGIEEHEVDNPHADGQDIIDPIEWRRQNPVALTDTPTNGDTTNE